MKRKKIATQKKMMTTMMTLEEAPRKLKAMILQKVSMKLIKKVTF